MSYGRMLKPRFYMDNFNWQASKGLSRNTALSIVTGSGTIALLAGTKYNLFDMNPLNTSTFDSDTTSDTVSILIDMGVAGLATDSITIMNHDLLSGAGKIRVAYSASTMVKAGGTAVAFTSILNGAVTGDYSIPAADGDTTLTFTSNSSRYWLVEFEPTVSVAGWSDALTIGMIVLGTYTTLATSPEFPIGRSNAYDGVRVTKSIGGKAFGSASWTAPNTGDYSPFRGLIEETKMGGRLAYDFSVSYLTDTTVYPSDSATPYASANFRADVVNKCSMELIPFIWTQDSTSVIAGDYLYARFDQPSFNTSSVATNVESFSARIVQEF